MAALSIEEFTDPGCRFAFSAAPSEAREELARVAEHQPVGNDGYWALRVAEPAGA